MVRNGVGTGVFSLQMSIPSDAIPFLFRSCSASKEAAQNVRRRDPHELASWVNEIVELKPGNATNLPSPTPRFRRRRRRNRGVGDGRVRGNRARSSLLIFFTHEASSWGSYENKNRLVSTCHFATFLT